ncbi:MAG TPA: tetratricopeptide repeat protein, partial [Aggregatilineaceae bacterium]|nr:tetratricopeptide repeat protein [Aggregatilineaceae bacterium]
MSGTQDELKRAYNFIKHDQTDEAQAVLRPILAQEPENVHAWWLLAHALTDPGEIRDALTKVITLDPNYPNAPKARELLAQLDQHYPEEVEFTGFEATIVDEGVFATGPI